MKIKKFSIHNYRSLNDIKIDDFDTTTIFYGLNNAGKSNILNALNLIFKRKKEFTEDKGLLGTPPPKVEVKNFYSGIVENIKHDFYNNSCNEIKYNVVMEINKNELLLDKTYAKRILKKALNDNTYNIEFSGKINRNNKKDDSGLQKLERVILNKVIIYSYSDEIHYFPTLDPKKLSANIMVPIFEKLIEPFNDCVFLIPSARDMLNIKFEEAKVNDKLTEINSRNFKEFLYSLYLSVDNHEMFEKISDLFNSDRFNFGKISFSKEDEELEIMVKENNERLPIKYLGSGVLQILFIISAIIYTKSKIVCIEELEQNLSPDMQYYAFRALNNLLSNDSLQQIILSSHSSVFSKPSLGLIYKLEKKNSETKIYSKKDPIFKKKIKDHFALVTLPEDYYTAAELEIKVKENIKDGEKLIER